MWSLTFKYFKWLVICSREYIISLVAYFNLTILLFWYIIIVLIETDSVIKSTAPIRKNKNIHKRQSNRLSFCIQKTKKGADKRKSLRYNKDVSWSWTHHFLLCSVSIDTPFFHLYNRRLIRGVSLIRMPGLWAYRRAQALRVHINNFL